jgi:hypothetical protein
MGLCFLDQLFGVELETFTKTQNIDIPNVVTMCTKAIEDGE